MVKAMSLYSKNNFVIPSLGLGLSRIKPGKKTINIVRTAVDIGYRLFDTAKFYGNEKDLGKAILDSKVKREEFFVCSKLWINDFGYDSTLKAFHKTLKEMQLEYLDLFLLHMPVNNFIDSWKALIHLQKDKLIRFIGVSNFSIEHLNSIKNSNSYLPQVNQIAVSPFNTQNNIVQYCRENKIIIMAHSPLTRAQKIANPMLNDLQARYRKTTAQILLRWSVQNKFIPIPKSSNEERLKENINIFDFELTREDMDLLNSLNENYIVEGRKDKLRKLVTYLTQRARKVLNFL